MKKTIISIVLFSIFWGCTNIDSKVLLVDNFDDNSNDWVYSNNHNPVLIQRIDSGKLHLQSKTSEVGVISYIHVDIDDSKDFSIEAKLMLKSSSTHFEKYVSLDFGILKEEKTTEKINGENVLTTSGDSNFSFRYNNRKEILISKWEKGEETYYSNLYKDFILLDNYNTLLISKKGNSISYYVNDEIIYKQPFTKLPGKGIGFSTSTNSELWVDYIKITN